MLKDIEILDDILSKDNYPANERLEKDVEESLERVKSLVEWVVLYIELGQGPFVRRDSEK